MATDPLPIPPRHPSALQVIAQNTLAPPYAFETAAQILGSEPPPTLAEQHKKAELEQLVVDYLIAHPNFFQRHQALLTQILIPTQSGGVVNLLGKQREILHRKMRQWQNTVRTITANAEHNFEKMMAIHRLQCNLMHAPTLADMVAMILAQTHTRLGYTPLIWWWQMPDLHPNDSNFAPLPMADSSLMEFTAHLPALGFYPPEAQIDPCLQSWINDASQVAIVIPLCAPTNLRQSAPFTLGLLVLIADAVTLESGEGFSADFNDYLFAGRFAEWVARLLEGQWLRQSTDH